MDQRILEFIGDLRRAEMRISPSEALDALAASAEIGLEDRETFKSALATTLVKESRDLATFNRIFDLYFLDLQALGEGLKKALGPEDPKIQELLDRLTAEAGMELDDLTELMLSGQGSDMEMAIRQEGQGTGLERLCAPDLDIVHGRRRDRDAARMIAPRIVDQMQLQPARAPVPVGPGTEPIERYRGGVDQAQHRRTLALEPPAGQARQQRKGVGKHRHRAARVGVGQGRARHRQQRQYRPVPKAFSRRLYQISRTLLPARGVSASPASAHPTRR